MRRLRAAVILSALVAAGCGSSSTVTQTVIERAATSNTPPPAEATTSPTTAAPRPKSHTHTIPQLVGKRLDVAEEDAHEASIPFKVLGGGAFGVVVPSNWTVCEQEPSAGARATRVKLIVERNC